MSDSGKVVVNPEMKRNPIWLGVGFTAIPAVVLALGYINVHPEKYRNVPNGFGAEQTEAFTGIAWSADQKGNPPLKYHSDSFFAVRLTTEQTEVSSFWGLFNQPASAVEYEWRYEVENLTDDQLKITVLYELKNQQGGVLDSDEAFKFAQPGETVTIKDTDTLDYRDAKAVTHSGWRIWHVKQ